MADTASHADLMDNIYRYQRRIYDITRRHYLLGRDHLVRDLAAPARPLRPGARVLEIACGTGRNLAQIDMIHPECALYGLDISHEMLRSARAKLGARATLVQADACDFDAKALFGPEVTAAGGFDRVVLSYSLSMIPDWEAALRHAARQLRPGGQLHVVDFGDQNRLPAGFRRLLRGWLARFHVTPRAGLRDQMQRLADETGGELRFQSLYRDYARYGVLTRP